MVLSRFLPKNPEFIQMFVKSAKNAHETAIALSDLMDNYVDVENKVRKIRDLEHIGDNITHDLTNALTTTFVTPFDRDDIMMLASRLDDLVDSIEEAARRMWLYRMPSPTPEAQRLAKIIAGQTLALAESMHMLIDARHSETLRDVVKKVTSLEDDGDQILDEVLAKLYDGVQDIKGVISSIRWGELYQYLEDATDRAQDVAYTIEGILLKNA
ncbi:DUF47 domain-containing protein [Deinococcus roseus]|uniref:Phosphate transport regulator n=1 Tax=Deinococcus roseus TaxID=392414 RepID=A0ABQ2CUK0_9DEIO|nr:DUF47 domain-containing protein [Deinococcus roseus]GGJ19049.1 phosphate transport regulator [Deinococcus roseus]